MFWAFARDLFLATALFFFFNLQRLSVPSKAGTACETNSASYGLSRFGLRGGVVRATITLLSGEARYPAAL